MLYRQFKTQEELDDEYRPEARAMGTLNRTLNSPSL
jgi:hypothetical protein